MATHYIGNIPKYNSEVMKWDVYVELMESFFQANDIDSDEKRRAVLLSTIGSCTYTVLRNLTAPKAPLEKPLKDLLKLLKEHYAPRPNPIVQRCKFYSRNRQSAERIPVYFSELRALAEQCEFADYLDTALRDRFIAGINDDRLQRRLLAEPYAGLTLTKAVDLAIAMETASKNATTLHKTQDSAPATSVNAMPQKNYKRKPQKSQSSTGGGA